MNKRISALGLLVASLMLPSLAAAKGPVWKISSGEHQLFLGGTIHVLGKADYPLPEVFEQAYQQSSTIVFETDLRKLQSSSFQRNTLPYLMYPDGQSLDQFLSKETYRQLDLHLNAYDVSLEQLKRFKPGMLATNITLLELRRLGLAGTGVDQFYSSRAIKDQKDLGQLESALSQIQAIGAMGEGQEDEFIRHTLLEVESLPQMLQTLKQAWRSGDASQIDAAVLAPMSEDFPLIYESLLVERNLAWLPSIIEMLQTEEIEMILVGAAHLVGEDGLLTQLDALGYSVEQM